MCFVSVSSVSAVSMGAALCHVRMLRATDVPSHGRRFPIDDMGRVITMSMMIMANVMMSVFHSDRPGGTCRRI